MGNVIATREYVDGANRMLVDVRDDGNVTFRVGKSGIPWVGPDGATVSAAVLRQLADLADAAKKSAG